MPTKASVILSQAAAHLGQRWGRPSDSFGVQEETFAIWRSFVNLRLRMAWQRFPWPEITREQYRYVLRPNNIWDDTGAYAPGDQVIFGEGAYVALVPTSNDNPDKSPSVWARLKNYDSAIPVASGETYHIGDVRQYRDPGTGFLVPHYVYVDGVTKADFSDPLKVRKLPDYIGKFPFDLGAGVDVIGDVLSVWCDSSKEPDLRLEFELKDGDSFVLCGFGGIVQGELATAFVKYRLPSPDVFGEAFDAATAYVAGSQVYWADSTGGDWFDVLITTSFGETPLTHPEKFRRVEIPAVLGTHLGYAIAAEAFREDGQFDKASSADARAEAILSDEMENIERRQRQRMKISPKTYAR
jgi:hypothetical protein